MTLTKSEAEVMRVLWKHSEGLTRGQILEYSKESGNMSWKENSIHIILNGMLKKGAIREAGFVQCGKVYGRLYAPAISYTDYYAESLFNDAQEDDLPLLFSAMVHSDKVSLDTIAKLDTILQERKSELT